MTITNKIARLGSDGTIGGKGGSPMSPHTAGREDIWRQVLSHLSEPLHLPHTPTEAVTLQSKHAIFLPVGFRTGDEVEALNMAVKTPAAGTVPTVAEVALVSEIGEYPPELGANVVVAKAPSTGSSSLGERAIHVLTANYVHVPLNEIYTIPESGLYYWVILVNGTWGTTQPEFIGHQYSSAVAEVAAFREYWWKDNLEKSSLPAVGETIISEEAKLELVPWFVTGGFSRVITGGIL